MVYWYDGAALAATRSLVIALFWCLIKFTTTTTTTTLKNFSLMMFLHTYFFTNVYIAFIHFNNTGNYISMYVYFSKHCCF